MTLPPSDHFNGKTFFSPDHVNRSWREVLHWRRTSAPTPWPAQVPLAPQPPPPPPTGDDWIVTWIGHATFLIQTAAGNFLTDPQFSDCAGPFGRFGPRRVQPPGVALAALPRIDVILLSHDHYDHCDLPSLRALARRHDPLVITPLGNGALARRAGLRRIVELDWWQTHAAATLAPAVSSRSPSATSPAPTAAASSGAGDFTVTLTPARHWSNRLSGPRNARLWGGFMVGFTPAPSTRPPASRASSIENPQSKIENPSAAPRRWWFSGDTAYHPTLFHELRARLGPPALAMIPIGAYEPRWFMAAQHCNPAEAVQIHREVGAATSLAMHWGTWQLTDEGREEPPRALAAALAAAGLDPTAFRTLAAGESFASTADVTQAGGTPGGVAGST